MGNACSSCCNKGGRRRPEKPLTEPSPVFPVDRRTSYDSAAVTYTKRDSFDAAGNGGGRLDLLLPNSSPFTTSTTAAPSASATPRSTGGCTRENGCGNAEKRLSLGGVGSNGLGCGGVPATLSLDPLAGVATVVRTGSGVGGGGGGDHHGGGGGGGAKRSFVSRTTPWGRQGSGEFRNVSESKVSSFFCKYRDPSTSGSDEAVTTEGVEQLCKDLDLRPEEFRVLVLAWKCGAAQMCRFTRSEFCRGCRSLRADNARTLQARLSDATSECLNNGDLFKDLYRFTYSFGLEPAQKVLPAEMACSLWQLVFNPARNPGGVPPLLPKWLAFVREHPEQVRGIPRDTWNMFLNLTESPAGATGDLSLYDDEEAWPTLFDDFVEYENDKANQNVSKKWNER